MKQKQIRKNQEKEKSNPKIQSSKYKYNNHSYIKTRCWEKKPIKLVSKVIKKTQKNTTKTHIAFI